MRQPHTFWQNPAYYRGIVELKQTQDGFVPQRFTDRQVSYLGEGGYYLQRIRCSAGSSIAMLTDAEWIELELVVQESVREYAYVQIVIDGIWRGMQGMERLDGQLQNMRLRFMLPSPPEAMPDGQSGSVTQTSRSHQVELFFPTYAHVSIVQIQTNPGAAVHPAPQPSGPRLLAFGDSITQGADARSPATAYPVQFARLLGGELLNQAVGGHVFDPGSFDPELPYEADLITVAYGINDWYHGKTAKQIEDNARQFLTRIRARYPGKPILVITPLWSIYESEQKIAGTVADVRRTIAAVAAEGADSYSVDGYSLLPDKPHLFADGLHPTDEGYGHYAAGLYRFWSGLKSNGVGI